MKKILIASMMILASQSLLAKDNVLTCTSPDESFRVVITGGYVGDKYVATASLSTPNGGAVLKSVQNSMFRTLEGTMGEVDNHHDYQLTLLDEGFGLTTTAFLLDSEYVDRIGQQPGVSQSLSCK